MPDHPLTGVRVIEVGIYMAGPFCAMQLADLGADVIKVENPEGGDIARDSAPFLDGESSPFIRLNRNKRSLAINLKAPEGKEVFRQLVQGADVVVENLRPGTMADLELDYQRLSTLNPRLVYVAASGWGQTGPYSQLAGLDIMAQAMSGLMSITGEPNGNPVKVGVPICDLVCALYGTIGALSALRVREQTGHGQFIDVSLFESGVSLEVWEAGRYHHSTELAVVLRCAGPSGVGERGAFQGQPLASRASGHPDPDDRTGDVAQAAGSLGIATPEGGRSLRRDPDLRSSFQRLATSGARLLLERAAFKAGRCRADRLPDTFLGYAGATVAGGTRAGRAQFGSAAGAGEDRGGDRGTQDQGNSGRE